jgi:hypothetical protein
MKRKYLEHCDYWEHAGAKVRVTFEGLFHKFAYIRLRIGSLYAVL